MDKPRFSLIVATLDRPVELRRLLDSVKRQGLHEIEIIVVDQSTNDATEDCCTKFSSQLQIQYLRTSERNLSRARNIGIRKATGEIIGFPDDDCWYPDDFLLKVSQWFLGHMEYGLFSCQYIDQNHPHNPLFDKIPGNLNEWNLFKRASSVTLFVSQDAASGIFFDQNIGLGSPMPGGEEYDYALQILRRKVNGFYDPRLVLYHLVTTQNRTSYGLGLHYAILKAASRGSARCIVKVLLGTIKDVLLSPVIAAARARLKIRFRAYTKFAANHWSALLGPTRNSTKD